MIKKNQKDTLELRFGLAYPPIDKQLRKAKVAYDPDQAEQWEKERKAIYMLAFGGIITDSVINRCFQKLFNKIGKNCSFLTKPKKT